MKQVKVDKMILQGNINGDFQEGEQVIFDTPLTIEGGMIHKDGDNVVIVYDTLKNNMYGHDITPKVNFTTIDEREDNPSYMVDRREITYRSPNDDEYNAINKFLKDDYGKGYKDMDRNGLTVYDINENFKIINSHECRIYKFSDGKETVSWDTYSYAYKHGLIYPYDINETDDDCEENISGLFKK